MLFKRIKDWATTITSFRTGDVIPVDGPSGTAKMSKDTLLQLTSQNALAVTLAKLSLIYETKENNPEGYFRTNSTNGTPYTGYIVGERPELLSSISAYFAKVKVSAGSVVWVPYINPVDYIFAYPVLVNEYDGFIEIYDTREAESKTIDGQSCRKVVVSANGYLVVSKTTNFKIFCEEPTYRGSEKYGLTEAEQTGACLYLGVNKVAANEVAKLEKIEISGTLAGYHRTNSSNGTPQPYSQGDVLELLTGISSTYVKIPVSEGEIIWVPYINPASYIFAYPVLVDQYNGYLATYDTREAENKVISGGNYRKITISANGYLVVSNIRAFDIYSQNPTRRKSETYGLTEKQQTAALSYFGIVGASVPNYYDYNVAVKMNKALLKSLIESASNGCCTVLWDDNGYPSLMRKIPIASITGFDTRLVPAGSTASYPIFDYTPHPAFIVGGVQKRHLYAGVFMNSIYNGVPVSWFGFGGGLTLMRSKNIGDCKTLCAGKGTGWHLETIWERSLISLIINKIQGPKPKGNNNRGRSSGNTGLFAECADTSFSSGYSAIPGNWQNGGLWVNGSQPVEWSHDLTRWGIFDFVGGFHEFVDLAKSVDGKIYLADDNDFTLNETSWTDTGAHITYDGSHILFSNEKKTEVTGSSVSDNWVNIYCDAGYDTLSEAVRKRLATALICPRLNSSDASALFDFDGTVQILDGITAYPFMGGALEYGDSGLGRNYWKYPNTEAHNNMGSRLFFIE